MYFLDLLGLCEEPNFLRTLLIIKTILKILFILIPIILMYVVSKELFKCIINNDSDALKKSLPSLVKKFIAALVIFLIPSIVNYAFSLVSFDNSVINSCFENSTEEKIEELQAKIEAERAKIAEDVNLGSIEIESTPEDLSNGEIVEEVQEPELLKNDEFRVDKVRISLGNYKKFNQGKVQILSTFGHQLNPDDFIFESSNPAVVSVDKNGNITSHFGGIASIVVTSKSDPSKKASCNVNVIHTLYTNAKVNSTIQATNIVTGQSETIPAGSTGVYNGIIRAKKAYPLGDTLKIGNNYYAISSNNVTPYSYYVDAIYSKDYVEDFVNSFGFKSDTQYLFWTSHGSQMEYMFRGSEGHWRLVKEFNVSTGDALGFENSDGGGTTGLRLNNYKIGRRGDAGYGVDIIWKDNGGGGSNPWHIGGGARYPKSHGCTRFNTEDLQYLLSIHDRILGSRIIDF